MAHYTKYFQQIRKSPDIIEMPTEVVSGWHFAFYIYDYRNILSDSPILEETHFTSLYIRTYTMTIY